MKNWLNLLLCFLLSGGIWLIHNLSQTYTAVVDVPVAVSSNIEGRAARSVTNASVSARISTQGFIILAFNSNDNKPVEVMIDSKDLQFVGNDIYSASQQTLAKYSADIFGKDCNVESVITSGINLRFTNESYREVPIRAVLDLRFKDQYMAASDIVLNPDTILIYGDPSRLEGIESVVTRPVSKNDIDKDIHGSVKIDPPSGVRLSVSQVDYELAVTRYVEISSENRIITRNVPKGTRMALIPPTVTVKYKCAFPVIADPREKVVAYVDYRDFNNSMSGHCIVKLEKVPDGVLDYKIEPEVCECFLEADWE